EHLGLSATRGVSLTGVGDPERVPVVMVTDGTLPALGIRPFLGRTFTREDDSPGSAERVLLTYAYWQRKFGGDRAILGRSLRVDDKPREVIGVLPKGFDFLGSDAAMLLPLRFNPAEVFVGNFAYEGIARLKPGVTIEAANRDIARLIPLVSERFPLPPGFSPDLLRDIKLGPNVHPLEADVIGEVGGVLWVLLGAVGLVLLIACANVANLFLIRAEGRQQELAIRSALGAGRWRLARELFAESITLGLLGGALGVGLAWAGLRVLVGLAPTGLPRLGEIGISAPVLAFTLAVSVAAGLLFGVAPVLKYATPRLGALKDGGRSASQGRERHRARSALVVAEIALALILLVASGLMVRTFVSLRSVDPGFTDPAQVLTLRLSIPPGTTPDAEQTVRTFEQVLRRLEQLPGVTSAGMASSMTMDGNTDNEPLFLEDFPEPAGKMPPMGRVKWISPNHFETMGTRFVAGRGFGWSELYNYAPVVLVSENLARTHWARPADALGRRVRLMPKDEWREIVGVVADERDDGVARPAPAVVYLPFLLKDFWGEPQYVQRNMAFAIRSTRLASPGFMQEIQQAVWGVNPGLPLSAVRTLDQIVSRSMAQTSFALIMLGIAAGVALMLGLVGIYGVVAYIATQRTREIGIRVALGAQRGDVSRLFLRHGLVLTVAGVAIGLAGAFGVTRLMGALLFGVSPVDAPTFATVALALGVVTAVATYIPARRAARVDPIVALRADV
ncbi:MAG TPA: ABC transporter permease, partial [Vicinamibacterales bacterium]|nr:ABC transporter permease [Vicinamibacterales bacterium]